MVEINASNTTNLPRFPDNKFGVWDYVVFALLLAISSAIGLYYGCTGKKQSSASEFLMAGRSMGILPVALSLMASFMSAITLLGTPSEIAVFGTHYWLIVFAYFFVIPAATHLFVPIFYNLNLTSVFEYLEKRFSRGVRTYACITYIIQTELYMALVLYAPCLALSVVTGLNKWIAVSSVGIVCIFYTTIGGMKAVMWTDVVQIIMMFIGMIGVIIKGAMEFGGFENIWYINEQYGRVFFWDPDPNPTVRHTFWSLIIGGTFTWLAIYGVNQAQVQRALCTPTLRQGQIAMWLNLPGLVGLLSICAICGMVIFAEYAQCNPMEVGRITEKDQLLPLYVMDKINIPGFPGFFTACIFSGALSTISSGLNSLSAVLLQDLILIYCFKNMSDSRAALTSKVVSVVCGVAMILLTLVAAQLGGILQAALGIFGIIGGPILGLFVLGIFYPWANHKGAYLGLTLGLAISLWIGIGAQVHRPKILGIVPPPMGTNDCPPSLSENFNTTDQPLNSTADEQFIEDNVLNSFYQISYMWYSAFAVFITTISGLLFSLITGPNKLDDVDPSLINPCVLKISKMFKKGMEYKVGREDVSSYGYSNSAFSQKDENISKASSLHTEITEL